MHVHIFGKCGFDLEEEVKAKVKVAVSIARFPANRQHVHFANGIPLAANFVSNLAGVQ